MHLASLVSAAFPDANVVSMGVACVLGVVEQYGFVGKWVTARIKHTGVFCISTIHFAIFQTIIFSSDYSAGRYRLRGEILRVL